MTYKIRTVRKECQDFSKARLQISVGQLYHEGEKFYATALWASKTFDEVLVNLCDSLQRHNLALNGYTPFAALNKSILLGDEWLTRNKKALAILPKLQITRWENWKTKDGWGDALQTIRNMYEQDTVFQKIIDDSVLTFLERRRQAGNINQDQKKKFSSASKAYLLEEAAVTLVMSGKDIAEIYPGTFPAPVYYLRERNMPSPTSMTTIAFMRAKETIKQIA